MKLDPNYLNQHLLTFLGLLCIVGLAIAAQWIPSIVGLYPMATGGILALVATHKGIGVASDYVATKADSGDSTDSKQP